MDPATIREFITQIALIFGGWTVILTAIVVFISQLATRRLFDTWDKKNQIEIDRLRHLQSEYQLILKEIISATSSNQSQIQVRKIEAIDKLWHSIVELRSEFSSITTFFDILYPSEYKKAVSKEKSAALIEDVSQNQLSRSLANSSEIEKYRPYLGEPLWQIFDVYRILLARLGVLIIQMKEGKDVPNWREDEIIHRQLKALLYEDEYKEVNKSELGSIRLTKAFIENKIVNEIGNILSGRQSSLEGLRNSLELQKIMAKGDLIFEENSKIGSNIK